MTSLTPANASAPIRGLRANALAAVVMLLIQYCLGISVNLYSTLPGTDHGKSLFAGFASGVGDGPLLLSLHALLGTLLFITALAAVIRCSRLAMYDLSYDHETVAPGQSLPQLAFQLVGCGADLLSGLRYADAVPTPDAREAKRTAKLMAKRFNFAQGRRAAVFLAQAMSTWYVEMIGRLGDDESAAVHANLGRLIQEFFPLDPADFDELERLGAEYRVMDDHDMTGRTRVTGWHTALLDTDFADGRDVDTDAELLEIQMRYASRYLRLKAECRAIAICAGDEEFGAIEPQLFSPEWPGYEILEYDLADLKWWTHTAELWHESGERAVAAETFRVEP